MTMHLLGAYGEHLGLVAPFVLLLFGSLGVLWMTRQYTTASARSAVDDAVHNVRDRLRRGEISPDEYQRIAAMLRG